MGAPKKADEEQSTSTQRRKFLSSLDETRLARVASSYHDQI